MLDFKSVSNKEQTYDQLIAGLTVADLATLTNEMIDTILEIIAEATDADVVFQPVDENANDPYATDTTEENLPWTLGHVIVHITASSEESAFLGTELARGVAEHGRSRYETPWTKMKTIAQCRARLEESRRMRLHSLKMWPNEPHADNQCESWPGGPVVNCYGRFLLGLYHESDHLEQLKEIMRQAKAA